MDIGYSSHHCAIAVTSLAIGPPPNNGLDSSLNMFKSQLNAWLFAILYVFLEKHLEPLSYFHFIAAVCHTLPTSRAILPNASPRIPRS